MKANKAKRNRKPMLLVFLMIVLVAAVGGIWLIIDRNLPSTKQASLTDYFQIESSQEIPIVADGVISGSTGRMIDESLYLDYDSVHTLINPSIYYEEAGALLIVTTPTELITFDLSEGDLASKEARFEDGTLYLSLDFVNKYSDVTGVGVDLEELTLVSVQKTFSYEAASVSEASSIRTEGSIKGEVLKEAQRGEELRLLDQEEEGDFQRILTSEGLVGYIAKEALGASYEVEDTHVSPIGEYTTLADGSFVNMAFHQTTSQAANNALSEVLTDVSGINVIAPTWFFLDSVDGEMTSLASKSYVEEAHSRNLRVWAVMNDFDGAVASSDATAEALSTFESRQKIIQTVVTAVVESGADGINVDFEKVTQNSGESFLEMIRELSVECRNHNLVLSIDNYVPTFTRFMGRSEQARVADYIVTMCYDEHTSSSEEAGSVSSISFLEQGLIDTYEEGVPKEKMIAAIPFYTRLWNTKADGSVSCTAYGMSDADEAVSNLGMETAWDEETGQNYGSIEVGGETCEIWLEDASSISLKMDVIRTGEYAGVAEWKLGQEKSEIWNVISS